MKPLVLKQLEDYKNLLQQFNKHSTCIPVPLNFLLIAFSLTALLAQRLWRRYLKNPVFLFLILAVAMGFQGLYVLFYIRKLLLFSVTEA